MRPKLKFKQKGLAQNPKDFERGEADEKLKSEQSEDESAKSCFDEGEWRNGIRDSLKNY